VRCIRAVEVRRPFQEQVDISRHLAARGQLSVDRPPPNASVGLPANQRSVNAGFNEDCAGLGRSSGCAAACGTRAMLAVGVGDIDAVRSGPSSPKSVTVPSVAPYQLQYRLPSVVLPQPLSPTRPSDLATGDGRRWTASTALTQVSRHFLAPRRRASALDAVELQVFKAAGNAVEFQHRARAVPSGILEDLPVMRIAGIDPVGSPVMNSSAGIRDATGVARCEIGQRGAKAQPSGGRVERIGRPCRGSDVSSCAPPRPMAPEC
jgi:hypothetical protein